MNIVNMTPHVLSIHLADGSVRTVDAPTDDQVRVFPNLIARCTVARTLTGVRDGIEMWESIFGAPSPLPESQEDTIIVVSSIYLSGLRAHGQDRPDVFVPGEAVRDAEKRVIGCKGLSR